MNQYTCNSNDCKGTVERYAIYSPKENTTYPNRFWGVGDYCEKHMKEDQKQGFVLMPSNEEKTFVL